MAGIVSSGVYKSTVNTKSVAGGANVTLTQAELENRHQVLTGALTANINVVLPLTAGYEWLITNNTSGAYTLTVIGSSGTGIVIQQGCSAVVRTDGTNIVRVSPDVEQDGDLRGVPQMLDTNGNELLKFTTTAAAVNEFTLANSATGSGPTLSATGGDTNIDLTLAGKGTGNVKVKGGTVAGASYGELYEDTPAGTALVVTTAATYYGWVNATEGVVAGAGLVTSDVTQASGDRLICGANGAGVYEVIATVTLKGPNSSNITVGVHKNGAIQTNMKAYAEYSATTKVQTISIHGLISLVSTDYVDLRFTSNTNGDTLTIYDVNLSIKRIA